MAGQHGGRAKALAEFVGTELGRKYPQAVKVVEDAGQKVTKARGHFPGDDAVVKLP